MPHLRIVEQTLWDAAKEKQQEMANKNPAPHLQRRPKTLFSNLLKCGNCGGGFGMISARAYGCTHARKGGKCKNKRTVARSKIEAAVLGALENQFMRHDLFTVFC